MSRIPLAFVALVVWIAPAGAEEPDTGRTLLEAATACPVDLYAAMSSTYRGDRRPVRASLAVDDTGALVMQALVRIEEKDDRVRFETWRGFLHAGGWVPRRHAVEDADAIREAEAAWTHLAPNRDALRQALHGAVRTDERPGPLDVVLAQLEIARTVRAEASA